MDLLKLAERVEQATGEYDPELCGEIHDTLPEPKCVQPPNYCTSLDAAMTLANGFVLLHLSEIGADGLCLCRLGDPTTTPFGEWSGIGATLPLAVDAAALRARAAASAQVSA